MSAPAFALLEPDNATEGDFNPFTTGEVLRESFFYGADSAYSFQYRDFSPRKYANDDEWLQANKGFSIQRVFTVLCGHPLAGPSEVPRRSDRVPTPETRASRLPSLRSATAPALTLGLGRGREVL